MRPMPGLVDCINREWCDYIGPSTTISRPFQRNGLLYISKVLSTKTRLTCVTQVSSRRDGGRPRSSANGQRSRSLLLGRNRLELQEGAMSFVGQQVQQPVGS